MSAPPWLEILDDTIRACAARQRGDLVDRLLDRRAKLLEPGRRVVVAGFPGKGKSHLVNALVGAEVCAVGDDLTTTVPTVLRHAEQPTAALVTARSSPADAPVDAVTARANQLAFVRGDVVRAEVGLPRALLGAGLVLVDSPGFGAPGCPRTERAMTAVADADAVLVVTDATTELSPVELELLTQVGRLCPTVLVALTKIDLVPGWRRVAEADRRHLARVGVAAPLVPVSSVLRAAAVRAEDQALNRESGFAELIGCLRRDVLTDPGRVAARAAAATSGLAVEQLITPLRAECAASPDPGQARASAEWRAATLRVERLGRESARWQTRLTDDVADLVSDLDYDLRERTRRILREVDDYFDAADPAKVWPEFDDWVRDSLTEVAEVHAGWLLDRFEWIAARVARQVVPDAERLPARVLRDLAGEHTEALRTPPIEKFTPVQKAFVGLRGSYSGLLMSGLATTLAGLPLINPISLGAGVAFGARSVFEERGARLKRRQAVAKTTAQRHVDDFFLRYSKESRDATRYAHRALRDRFTEVAQELREAAAESARELKRGIDAEATRRARDRAELERLLALRDRIEAVRGLSA
ncbi:dynamin family protein [Actinokineospora auranticolor]|uniref:Dynamin family protein n=1 Tax=Actinokineospora auranticolor TaxID=155976 RepID=A0A2S6GFQ0_9PSEU|nr:dynamin family protein [Actinokineospora auranticolor]PPK64044.1 dynamin family protein [Actinokineospora auranticolor]